MVEALALAGAAVVLPHVLPLHRVRPSSAAAVWLSALALRAVVAATCAAAVLDGLPRTAVFDQVRDSVVHFTPVHVDLGGDRLAHAAALAPAALLAGSLLVFSIGSAIAGWRLRRAIRTHAIGDPSGPTVVVRDRRVVLALPVLGAANVMISDAALAALDDAELRAGVAHERGHLARGHRPLRFLAGALGAVARPLPGTGAAGRGLRLSLERDADEHAVRNGADPLALASAICKAAGSQTGHGALALAKVGPTEARLDQLLAGGAAGSRGSLEAVAIATAAAIAAAAGTLVVVGAEVLTMANLGLAIACPA